MTYSEWRDITADTPVNLAGLRCRIGGRVTDLGDLFERAGVDLAWVEVTAADGDEWVSLAELDYGFLAGAARTVTDLHGEQGRRQR
jgi:hypothetical protein